MCGFDYDADGTYLGTQRPRLVVDNPRPDIEELRQKCEAAWLADDIEEEMWAEFELSLASHEVLR